MGELQVTIIAGRNLRSDGKGEVAYCSLDLPGNKTCRTASNKNREPVWNESFNFDLMSLDNDEVLIQVFGKRRISTDKFLGQIQLPIKGLNLSKEISWHYLTDRPKNLHELPDHMRVDPTQRLKSPHKEKDDKKKGKEEKEDKTYITGEISVSLNFTHRFLLRGSTKSKAEILSGSSGSDMSSPPVSPSASSPPKSPNFSAAEPSFKASGSIDLPNSPRKESDGSKTTQVPKLVLARERAESISSSPPVSPHRKEQPEKQVSFPAVSITPKERERNSVANVDEAKAIETAFREKLQLVSVRY